MAGVERVGLGRPAAIRVRGGTRPSPGFSVPAGDTRSDAVTAPIALGSLLSPREHTSSDETPARQQASALLSELAHLQRTLLGGGDPFAVLQRLDGMVDASRDAASPPLLAILAAVRLRARVELARRSWGEKR